MFCHWVLRGKKKKAPLRFRTRNRRSLRGYRKGVCKSEIQQSEGDHCRIDELEIFHQAVDNTGLFNCKYIRVRRWGEIVVFLRGSKMIDLSPLRLWRNSEYWA